MLSCWECSFFALGNSPFGSPEGGGRSEDNMSVAAANVHFATVADLLKRLGSIAPDRVRIQPTPGTATEANVIELHDRWNRLFELVDGVLVEKQWDSTNHVLRRF